MSERDPYPIPTTPDGQAMLLAMIGRDVGVVAREVNALSISMGNMATKVEMEAMRGDLHRRIDSLSEEFKRRDKAISDEVDRKSVGSTLDRFLSLGTRIITFCLVLVSLGGLAVGVVRYFDSIPPAAAKGNP